MSNVYPFPISLFRRAINRHMSDRKRMEGQQGPDCGLFIIYDEAGEIPPTCWEELVRRGHTINFAPREE